MKNFQARRLENIKQNVALLGQLGVEQAAEAIHQEAKTRETARKKRKLEKTNINVQPSRISARIASTRAKPKYNEETLPQDFVTKSKRKPKTAAMTGRSKEPEDSEDTRVHTPDKNIEELRASWSSWTPTAPSPTRDETGKFHFPSHPTFTPNKSPEEVLREGCFGGSYFRPLHSAHLRTTIRDDYLELPPSWITAPRLPPDLYLISPNYNAEINKYKVACGQSIEEWEKAGWIDHTYDVRGWFQWYCRFFQGRRCVDDDRQVSRWRKCVGQTGRWRRMLLKKYVQMGVRDVADEGSSEDGDREVSPVMHQTCHHWAFCVTQDVLDEYWRTGK